MRIVSCLIVLVPLLALRVSGAPTPPATTNVLDVALRATNLWNTAPGPFLEQFGRYGFRWTEQDRQETARAAVTNLTFVGLRVWEALARFKDGRLDEVVLQLYNRGDAGEMTAADFEALVGTADTNIAAWAGAKGSAQRTEHPSAGAVVMKKVWVSEPHRLDLEWSFTRGQIEAGKRASTRMEYVKLTITRLDPAKRGDLLSNAPAASTRIKTITPMDLKRRVEHEPNGDVVITNVPMVDQGQKGYCIAATTERLLRYFGRDLDQHEMAQIANTSAEEGTTLDGMLKALRRIAGSMQIRVETLVEFNYDALKNLIEDYNHAARKAGVAEIKIEQIIQMNEVYRQMKPDVLRQTRVKKAAELAKFQAAIKKNVDAGLPLAWSLMVGMTSETPAIPEGVFGHMRLIIGYNTKAGEILYTDSWGPGHEKKRMQMEDAWFPTTGLYVIVPRGLMM